MKVFITGGTDYLGTRLAAILLQRNHEVKALIRKGSENRLPQGVQLYSAMLLMQALLKMKLVMQIHLFT